MLTPTLQKGLSGYAIGEKIRTLRPKKKMGLVALVFSVGLDYFFSGAREKPLAAVMRKSDRVKLPERPGGRDVAFRFESLDYGAAERKFNAYLAEFFPMSPDKLRVHQHPGVEFIHTLDGVLSLHLGGEEYVLEGGDSIYFDSGVAHAYRRSGGKSWHGPRRHLALTGRVVPILDTTAASGTVTGCSGTPRATKPGR